MMMESILFLAVCKMDYMKTKLYKNKIEVRKSNIHGWGVFAKEDIKKGEILEECTFISTPYNIDDPYCPNSSKYRFYYPQYKKGLNKNEWKSSTIFSAISLGYGSLYNDSKSEENSTAILDWDIENQLMVFSAKKDIKFDNEILLYYSKSLLKNEKIK